MRIGHPLYGRIAATCSKCCCGGACYIIPEILADPETPAWIKEGIKRLRKSDPIYLAFIEALHDMRIAVPVYAREG